MYYIIRVIIRLMEEIMKEILVIVPAYNEEGNIKNVINELKQDAPNADILIVNDCSQDNTVKVVEECKTPYISMPFNLGYAGVIQAGFKYAVDKGYKYVVQFDGDGQHVASEIAKLYKYIEDSNADIVIGSRFIEKTQYNHSFFRNLGTNIFRFIIKATCKTEITDPTSGFQILNRKVYERYSKMSNYPDYPDANLIIEMLYNGFKIKEVPVIMRERTIGISMHAGIFKPIKYMIKMFYSILIILIKYMGKRENNMEVNR